jgi:hypothetical protein
MEAPDTTTRAEKSLMPDFRAPPPLVRLEETIASVDADSVPDPPRGGTSTSTERCATTDGYPPCGSSPFNSSDRRSTPELRRLDQPTPNFAGVSVT